MNRESDRDPLPFYGREPAPSFPRGRLDGPTPSRVRTVRYAAAVTAQEILISVAILLLTSSTHAQELSSATPATKDYILLIDSNVEVPPRYNGNGAIPRPAGGNSIEFQIFMPEAAGLEVYSFQLAFQDTGLIFSDHFDILSARTEARPLLPVPEDQVLPEFRTLQLDSPRGSKGPQRSTLLMTPWHVSNSGLIGVIKLLAKQDIPSDFPLVLDVNIAVLSKTPPTRLIILKARRKIGWRGTVEG